MNAKRVGIYLLTHIASGRQYIGQSINIDSRLRDHASGKSGSGRLGNAISKHGWSAFEYRVLQLCEVDELDVAEAQWISELGTLHPAGFNLTTGGTKYRFTDSARAHIAQRTRQALSNPEVRTRISEGVRRAQSDPALRAMIRERADAGRAAMSPEARSKMKAAMTGLKRSEETKAKMRGRLKSEAWKAMMSERQSSNAANIARLTALARNQSPETREKIAAAHRGMKASDETRAKISAAKTGVKLGPRAPFSDETRARMSASAKVRRAREKQQRESQA